MLYIWIPMGPQRIEFNAHRVFSVAYLLSLLESKFAVADFSYVHYCGDLHESVPLTPAHVANNYGCRYGCGIFELLRR
jgi:hypothetical protein